MVLVQLQPLFRKLKRSDETRFRNTLMPLHARTTIFIFYRKTLCKLNCFRLNLSPVNAGRIAFIMFEQRFNLTIEKFNFL